MGHTITVRLDPELARWLEQLAERTGISQGKLIRTELEKARQSAKTQSFMRLAGAVRGPKGLSARKGFSKT